MYFQRLANWLRSFQPRTHKIIDIVFSLIMFGVVATFLYLPQLGGWIFVICIMVMMAAIIYLGVNAKRFEEEEELEEEHDFDSNSKDDLDKPTFLRQRQAENTAMIHDDVPEHPQGDKYFEIPAFMRHGKKLDGENQEFTIHKGGLFLVPKRNDLPN